MFIFCLAYKMLLVEQPDLDSLLIKIQNLAKRKMGKRWLKWKEGLILNKYPRTYVLLFKINTVRGYKFISIGLALLKTFWKLSFGIIVRMTLGTTLIL